MDGFENVLNRTEETDVFNSSYVMGNESNSTTLPWVDVCLDTIFMVFGCLGNGLLIWVLGFRMKETGFFIYVLNLAVADFGFCALLATQIPIDLAKNDYIYGLMFCRIEQYLARVFYYAGTLLITTICLERCVAIRHPIWYKCRRPKKVPVFACALVWTISCLLALMTLFNLELVFFCFNDGCGHQCFVKDLEALKLLTTSEVILVYLLPLCTIFTCSSIIVYQLTKDRKVGTKRCQVNRTVCFTALLFLVCWTPFQVSQYIHVIQLIFLPNKISLISLAGQFNSCVNPFIYVLMGREIKKKVMLSFPGLRIILKRAFNE
uniref:G-protein coupled receptors family 1 profile domain-containing protein n=1 Tax=Lepisosteus oculatus TaxID=7918 RepID=W5MWN1_LEPOC